MQRYSTVPPTLMLTSAQQEEINNIHRARIAAQKRLDDLIEAVERVRDELVEIQRAELILTDAIIYAGAEEPQQLWRLPSGPVA